MALQKKPRVPCKQELENAKNDCMSLKSSIIIVLCYNHKENKTILCMKFCPSDNQWKKQMRKLCWLLCLSLCCCLYASHPSTKQQTPTNQSNLNAAQRNTHKSSITSKQTQRFFRNMIPMGYAVVLWHAYALFSTGSLQASFFYTLPILALLCAGLFAYDFIYLGCKGSLFLLLLQSACCMFITWALHQPSKPTSLLLYVIFTTFLSLMTIALIRTIFEQKYTSTFLHMDALCSLAILNIIIMPFFEKKKQGIYNVYLANDRSPFIKGVFIWLAYAIICRIDDLQYHPSDQAAKEETTMSALPIPMRLSDYLALGIQYLYPIILLYCLCYCKRVEKIDNNDTWVKFITPVVGGKRRKRKGKRSKCVLQ